MRTIKFRAWDIVSEKMYGENIIRLENWGDNRDNLNDVIKNYQPHIILMQYTGLKDKNGKEIYEGDIVIQEIWNGADDIEEESITDKFEGIIIWDTSGFGIQTKICEEGDSEVGLIPYSEFINLEVIGNIYESPELIK